MGDELDRLEEILEERVRKEPYGGMLRIPKPSMLESMACSVSWHMRRVARFLKSPQHRHKVRGVLLGASITVGAMVYSENPTMGLGLIVFLVLLHILIYPDMASLITGFIRQVLFDLIKKGSLASLLTPSEIRRKLKSVEYVVSASIPLLSLVILQGDLFIILLRTIAAGVLGVGSIAYYYLRMALDCWENPLRELSERNIFSTDFLILVVLFIGSIVTLYMIVPYGLSSIFGWLLVLLSYAFISTVLAVPSFQAAIHVTTYWRGWESAKVFREIRRTIRWRN